MGLFCMHLNRYTDIASASKFSGKGFARGDLRYCGGGEGQEGGRGEGGR